MKDTQFQPDGNIAGRVISHFCSALDKNAPEEITFRDFFRALRSPSPANKQRILKIRKIYEDELRKTGSEKQAKDACANHKVLLECVAFSAILRGRKADSILKHTGLLCADLDNLPPDALVAIKSKLKRCRNVAGCFISPTGHGLKVIFVVTADEKVHMASWWAIRRVLLNLTGIEIDSACKDVSRLCFTSYDPDPYINEDAIALVPSEEDIKAANVNPASNGNGHRKSFDPARVDRTGWTPVNEEEIWQQVSSYSCVPGDHGHNTLLRVTGIIFNDYGLAGEDDELGWRLLRRFNQECCFKDDDETEKDEWTDAELAHKVREVLTKPRDVPFGARRGGIPKPGFTAYTDDFEEQDGPAGEESADEAPPPQPGFSAMPDDEAEAPQEESKSRKPIETDFEDADDLLDEPLKRPELLIDGLLFKETTCVIGGGSKSYKSWSLLDMAISLSLGEPWWGMGTQKSSVLYINFELSRYFLQSRIRKIKIAKGLGEVKTEGYLKTWHRKGKPSKMRDLANALLLRAREGIVFDVIIFDPIYKTYGDAKENSNDEMAKVLGCLGQLARDTGCACVFGHHFAKGSAAGKEMIDRMSGAGVFARDPDTIITLTPHETDNSYTVEAETRYLPKMRPFVITWKHPLMVPNGNLNASDLKGKPGRKEAYSAYGLMEILDNNRWTYSEWRDAAEKEGWKTDTFKTKLKTVKSNGWVKLDGDKYVRNGFCNKSTRSFVPEREEKEDEKQGEKWQGGK